MQDCPGVKTYSAVFYIVHTVQKAERGTCKEALVADAVSALAGSINGVANLFEPESFMDADLIRWATSWLHSSQITFSSVSF